MGRAARAIVRATALAGGLALAAGCAGPIRHDVTVFHDWPADLTEKTFRIARKPGQEDSLEYRTYERIVRQELIAAGFIESPDPTLQVAFDYSARRSTIRYVDHEPVFSPYVSFGHYRRWGGVGFSAPLWSVAPYTTTVREVDRFERRLELEMDNLRVTPPQRIYEATSSNRGSDEALAGSLPLLMKAVLADFPGRSGIARQVDVMPPETDDTDGPLDPSGKPSTDEPPPDDQKGSNAPTR